MKKIYKIFLGILVIGIVLGILGIYMMLEMGADAGGTLFLIGALLVPTSIIGIKIYYIKSDPVRYSKFKQNQEQRRQENARRAKIYQDERMRAKAWSDEYDSRRRLDW